MIKWKGSYFPRVVSSLFFKWLTCSSLSIIFFAIRNIKPVYFFKSFKNKSVSLLVWACPMQFLASYVDNSAGMDEWFLDPNIIYLFSYGLKYDIICIETTRQLLIQNTLIRLWRHCIHHCYSSPCDVISLIPTSC